MSAPFRTNRRTRKAYPLRGGLSSMSASDRMYSTTMMIGQVRDLSDRWEFSNRDTDVEEYMRMFNINPEEEFGGVFIDRDALAHGDVNENSIYFITGSTPDLGKNIYQVNEIRSSRPRKDSPYTAKYGETSRQQATRLRKLLSKREYKPTGAEEPRQFITHTRTAQELRELARRDAGRE